MSKKIVIKQHDIKDCGAACLLSIIKYYNGNISLEKIKLDTCVTSKGISAYNLKTAAKNYGFDVIGLSISFDELIQKRVTLPCIAYLELKNGLKHYVVIYKICNNHFLVMDPAKGMIKLKYSDFKEIFKNVILEFSLISSVVNYENSNELLNIFFNILKSNKKIIISLFITSLLLTIFSILLSFYTKSIINSIDINLKTLFILIICVFAIFTILKIILTYLKNYYEVYLNKNIDVKLIPNFIKHIFNLPLSAISNRTVGEITTRVSELNSIKELFSNMFVTLSLNLLLAAISCIVLLIINYRLTIVLMIIILIYLINNLLWLKSINNHVENNINLETEFNTVLTNGLSHIISIKNNNNYPINRVEESLIKYLENSFHFSYKISVYSLINNFILEIGMFILNTFGFILILNGKLELIDLITYDSLYLYYIEPIKEIINLIPKYVYIKRCFSKINDFISLKEENVNNKMERFSNGDIIFENIDYSYNMYDYPIKNYSLKIKKGNKVLVMGKSGLGKSTLFKLLYLLYTPLKGNITIDSVNIKDYDLNTIRRNISYVSQNEAIYNDTLLNNITLGQNINKNKLTKILNICQVNDILDKKSLRLNTFVMEDESNLSGGEKSRIILARTLVSNRPIIIFDETLSNIAENDANKIIKDICDNFKEKTIIFISHFKPKYSFDQEVVGDFNG